MDAQRLSYFPEMAQSKSGWSWIWKLLFCNPQLILPGAALSKLQCLGNCVTHSLTPSLDFSNKSTMKSITIKNLWKSYTCIHSTSCSFFKKLFPASSLESPKRTPSKEKGFALEDQFSLKIFIFLLSSHGNKHPLCDFYQMAWSWFLEVLLLSGDEAE